MARASLVWCCCAALAGCQVVPLGWHPSGPPVPPAIEILGESVPLSQSVLKDREAVRQVFLRHIPPGTPVGRAQQILAGQGFDCHPSAPFPAPAPPRGMYLPPEVVRALRTDTGAVCCSATRRDLGGWHLRSYSVLVVLLTGGADAVADVQVGLKPECHSHEDFFARRPELHEPVGLPVEEARARMAAAGFRCTAGPGGTVDCAAFDEWLLGGSVVRVSLHPDAAGVVREARVPDKSAWFDAERCMWPHGDESTTEAVCKRAVFPLRLGCRYALFTAWGIAIVVMGGTMYPYGR